MTVDVGRSFRNFYDPATYMYHATMIMYNLDEQNTGRYVCRGIEQQHYRVSVYLHLYVPGEFFSFGFYFLIQIILAAHTRSNSRKVVT